ncbi:MAG: hypothetical protein CMK06_00830, partial [Ponticaulis sp.]|nr:hypothetical protein [Ponticaulis sp.]
SGFSFKGRDIMQDIKTELEEVEEEDPSDEEIEGEGLSEDPAIASEVDGDTSAAEMKETEE